MDANLYQSFKVILKELNDARAIADIFDGKGKGKRKIGSLRLENGQTHWNAWPELPDDVKNVIFHSMLGPKGDGPLLQLPSNSKLSVTLTKFAPGEDHQIEGTAQITDPEHESNPVEICCRGTEVCTPTDIYPEECTSICLTFAQLLGENDGGLPIQIISNTH